MALTKPQKETKEISEKSGDILARFANSKSTSKAIMLLHQRFLRAFNVSLFNAKKMSNSKEDSIRKDQQRLKKLFDEMQADKTLKESETIGEYNLDYYCLCHGQFVPDARYQDGISMLQELEENGGTPFDAVLAILVFQYLKDENRKQIKKCKLPECGKYFLAHNQRGEFCSVNHRVAHHRLTKSALSYKSPKEMTTEQTPFMQHDSEPVAATNPVSPS